MELFFLKAHQKSLWRKISHLLGQPQSESHELVFGIKTSRAQPKMLLGKWHIKPGLTFNSLLPIKLCSTTFQLFYSLSHIFSSFSLLMLSLSVGPHQGAHAGLGRLHISRGNHRHRPHRSLPFPISLSFSHSHPIKKKNVHLSGTIYME